MGPLREAGLGHSGEMLSLQLSDQSTESSSEWHCWDVIPVTGMWSVSLESDPCHWNVIPAAGMGSLSLGCDPCQWDVVSGTGMGSLPWDLIPVVGM